MYKEVKFSDISKEALEQLVKGAFLTVKSGTSVNTMTIGWGSIGFIWGKPCFTAMVRYSRYTYELIEKAADFTISIPLHGQMKAALSYCGTKSGKDVDKIKECNLSLNESKMVLSPAIDGCNIYLECKIVYKQPMVEDALDEDVKKKSYPHGDFHEMYFGEIVRAYVIE